MTERPGDLSSEHAKATLRSGVAVEALIDAIAVGKLFNIIARYANALDFAVPSGNEFDRAAGMLLIRGYA
jgi:alkylhydroperoxidase family enzyme